VAEAFAHAGKSDSASECTLSGVRWSVVEGGERHLVCHSLPVAALDRPGWFGRQSTQLSFGRSTCYRCRGRGVDPGTLGRD
jgi:hypothetical protein